MIEGLKPYPAYKDSGVEWLGKVPAHWEVRRLKRICRLAYGDALATNVRQDGPVPVYGSNGRVGTHSIANTKAPCIVIGRKGSFGKVNLSCEPVFAIDTTFFVDSRFTTEEIHWLYYLLEWLRLDELSKDSAVPGLDREDAYKRIAAVPPLPEQTAIVRFLDWAERRILRVIRRGSGRLSCWRSTSRPLSTRPLPARSTSAPANPIRPTSPPVWSGCARCRRIGRFCP